MIWVHRRWGAGLDATREPLEKWLLDTCVVTDDEKRNSAAPLPDASLGKP